MKPIKILLVDDDESKVCILRATLAAHKRKKQIELTVEGTSTEAKRQMRSTQYDLLLLDQNLPRRAGEGIIEGEGLDVLKELSDESEMLQPHHILIFSAYEPKQVGKLSAADFGWSFLRYSEDSNAWKVPLASKIEYIHQQALQAEKHDRYPVYDFDIAVVTALQDPEWSYIQEWEVNWQSKFIPGDYREYFVGEKRIPGKRLKMVGLPIREMGMVGASCAVASMIRYFRPKLVVIAGIAAGVVEEQKIGEIVVGKHAWNYDAGKVLEDPGKQIAYLPEPDPVPVDPAFFALLQGICSSAEFLTRMRARFAGKKLELGEIQFGPVASGSAVIESPTTVQRVLSQNRKARSLDMEVYGVYAACFKSPLPKPYFFSAKAVSDFALPGRQESDRRKAARHSAVFLEGLLDELATRSDMNGFTFSERPDAIRQQ